MHEEDPRDWQSGELKVVVNHEEQYSIWPADRDNPPGWDDVGVVGTKAKCLDHIRDVWTDMRPLSLRKHMEEVARNPPPEPEFETEASDESLPSRLSRGDHPIEASLRPKRDVATLKNCIDRNFVHVKFTETRGGTEIGFHLDSETDVTAADFSAGTGIVHLSGSLSLDFTKVRCVAHIDLATLSGTGRLELSED